MKLVEARYEKGLLKPTEPLPLRPGERVSLIVVRRPDPNRWNLDRFPKTSAEDIEQLRAIPKSELQTKIRTLSDEELAELELATDEALGRVEPINEPDREPT